MIDAGTSDAGAQEDAGVESDSGTTMDAGAVSDSGASDAGLSTDSGTDSGARLDASTPGVECITRRRMSSMVTTSCWQEETVEADVRLWLVSHMGDPEGAMSTSSPGILALYGSSEGAALFLATDASHTLYRGNPGSSRDFGTANRVGDIVSFTMDASRDGTPPPYPGCDVIPLIHVTCAGSTSL